MAGGGGTQTTTTSIPNELKPLATAYTGKAIDLSNNAYVPYTGDRFAGLNPTQQTAMDITQNRAVNGSPVLNQANSTITDLLKGGQTNPYLDQLVGQAQKNLTDQYTNTIRPQQDALAARSGSFGNAGVDQTITNQQNQLLHGLGDISTQMYGNAYNTDRQNQLSALGLAPQIGNQAYTDANQLLGVGNQQQANAQQSKDFAYQQWQDLQNQPYKNLQTLGAPFSLGLGSVSTSSGGGK